MSRSRKRAGGRRDNFLAKRYGEFEPALAALGLLEDFRLLAPETRKYLLTTRLPRPKVVADDSVRSIPGLRNIEARAGALLRTRQVALDSEGASLSISDFFAVGFALFLMYLGPLPSSLLGRLPPRRMKEGEEKLDRLILGNAATAIKAMMDAVHDVVVPCSAVDGTMLWESLEVCQESSAKPGLVVRVRGQPCMAESLVVDGKRRKVFRCGAAPGDGPFRWIELNTRDLGIAGPGANIPVFVQQHALDNLEKRIPIEPHRGRLHEAMMLSLLKPNVARREGRTLWIDCIYRGAKVGYLLMDYCDGRFVIRTFLFITMERTPEGRLLNQRLRLHRADKEYLGLDTLAPFVHGDIGRDEALRAHLAACGLEHLFHLGDHDRRFDQAPQNCLQKIKTYLGL